jgi:hypothetical protein
LKNSGIVSTVIWTGNGYHVLVPLQPLNSILEDMAEFAKFTEPSKYVLRFLEKHLSNGKSDIVHNSTVSFGNCMLRVPGSINSKHNNNNSRNQVSIIKKWNGKRFPITPLLGDFIAYLLDKKDEKKPYQNYYNNFLSKQMKSIKTNEVTADN